MIDINILRTNDGKEKVIQNLKNKFQEEKISLVDEIINNDINLRNIKTKADELRNKRNTTSKEIGMLMKDKKIEDANKKKEEVTSIN